MATTAPPLNSEVLEVHVTKLEMRDPNEEKPDDIEDVKEKLKKPTIGVGLTVFLILNIAMLIVGIITIHDCPIQPLIPIYLIVAGVLGIITKIIPILNRKRNVIIDRIVSGLFLIEFIWMIAGSYWIYSIYQPNYHPGMQLHCNKTAYLLAFWLLTLHYIFLLLLLTIPLLILCACWLCCLKIMAD